MVALGLGASLVAAYVHYRLLTTPAYTSFCDVNSTWNCTQAYLSPYGSLAGVPVALLGVIFFAGQGLLLAADRRGSSAAMGASFLLSAVGLAVTLYLAYASFFVLKSVCILCVLTYLAVLGLFVLTNRSLNVPMTTFPQRILTDLRALVRHPVAATLALLFAGGAGTAIAFFPRDGAGTASPAGAAQAVQAAPEVLSAEQRAQVAKAFDEQPRVKVPVDAAGAKVLIVKFNDFQCPACGHTHQLYKPILQKYEAQAPGQVRLVAKDYPLETECNPTMKRDVHAAACEAAVAVRLAQGTKRTALEDWLFTHQSDLTPESVRTAARDVGGVTDLEPRYKATLEAVKADATLGTELQVNSTPTFFVNGVRLQGVPPAVLDAIIEHELSKAAQAK
jgi:protein-disulfide isomerase/uncharacterized membrane protein